MTPESAKRGVGPRGRRRWRRIVLHCVAWPSLAMVCAMIAIVVYVAPRVASKSGAPRSDDRPGVRIGAAEPIMQFESHTCGLLSLAAAYRVYGLSEEDKNLRFRLGVDKVAHPFDDTSTGTLHPDLFRVLVQDGFGYTLLDPEDPGTERLLRAHLESGNVALFLIARRENGALHWVMSDALDDNTLRVVDSLRADPVHEPLGEFLADLTLSVVAIAPVGNSEEITTMRAHADGGAEMKRVHERLGKRKASR